MLRGVLLGGVWWRRVVLVWDYNGHHWINSQHWNEETPWPIHRGLNCI